MNSTSLYIAAFLPVLLVLTFYGIRRTNRHSAPSTGPVTPVRSASLRSERPDRSWYLGMTATLLPLAATAALLATHWQTLPARFPIHWGMHGQPNGWANRSTASVFGPLLLAVFLIGALGLMGELIARSSPGHTGRLAVINTARKLLLACSWFITALFCATSLLPLVANPTILVPYLVVGAVTFSLVIICWVVSSQLRLQSAITAGRNSTDRHFWKAGLIYVNPNDSALFIPKQSGFGYTLNFGRPISWLILAAILAVPLLLPFLLQSRVK